MMSENNKLPEDSAYWESRYSISDVISNSELADNDIIARFAFANDVKVKEKRVSKGIFKLRDTTKYPDEKAMSMQHVESDWNDNLEACVKIIKGTTHHVRIRISDVRNLEIKVSKFSFAPQENLDRQSASAKLKCSPASGTIIKSNILPSPSQALPHHASMYLYAENPSPAILSGRFYKPLSGKDKDIIQGALAEKVFAIYDNLNMRLSDFVCC